MQILSSTTKKSLIVILLLSQVTSASESLYGSIGIQVPKEQLRFSTLNANGDKTQDLLLDPNPRRNLTLSFHHPKFSLFAGLPLLDSDEKARGESEALDLRFKGKFKRLLPDLYFQKYRGFEIKDKLDGERSLGFLSGVETLHFGGNLTYFLKENFHSLHSGHSFYQAWENSREQSLSQFSYTLSTGIDHLKVKNLPDQQRALSQLRGDSSFQTLSFRGGGVYQYHYGRFVFEGSLALGPGFMHSETQSSDESWDLVINSNVALFIGVKLWNEFFLFLNGDVQAISGKVSDTQFSNDLATVELGFGNRF